MSVYDKSGEQLRDVFSTEGNSLPLAYDINQNAVFIAGPVSASVMTFNVGSFYTEWHPAPSSTGDVFYLRHKSIFDKYDLLFCGMSEWYSQIGTVPASDLMDDYFDTYYPNYTPYPGDANSAITSAFTVTPSNVSLTKYTTQGAQPRYYQKSYIRLNGRTICCILTHLDLRAEARAAQFIEALDAVQNEEYFIVLGDFNFQIQAVGDSEYNASVKVALDRGYNSAQNADSLLMTWYDGKTAESSSWIDARDNIFTSPNISIDSVTVDTTKLTDGLCSQYNIIIDHLPLIANITIN